MTEFKWLNPNHKNILVNQICGLRKHTSLCDIKLIAENNTIYAHKIILSAMSPFFNTIIEHNHLENNDEYKFTNINFETLEQIIEFIYSGNIVINESNVVYLMEAADMLAITSLIKPAITEYIISNMLSLMKSCIQIYAYCKKFRYEDLAQYIMNFITDEYHINYIISSNDSSYKDTPPDILEHIIHSDNVKPGQLRVLFDIWIRHNDSPELCSPSFNSPFDPISYKEYLGNLDEKKSRYPDLITKFKNYMNKTLFFGLEITDERIESLITEYENYDACASERLVLIYGGSTATQVEKDLECLIQSAESYYWSPELPSRPFIHAVRDLPSGIRDNMTPVSRVARYYHAYCADDRIAYVLGGGPYGFTNHCEAYDIRDNSWRTIASLPGDATIFAAAAMCEGFIYFIGGCTAPDSDYDDPWRYDIENTSTNKVSKYNINTDSWVPFSSLIHERAHHGACSVNGVMYAFGGISPCGETLSSVEKYDETMQKWVEVSEMPMRKQDFAYVAYNKYIYVFGGRTKGCKNDMYPIKTLKSIDRYDTLADKWEPFGELLAARAHMSCCRREFRIYLTGGQSIEHSYLSNSFMYNPVTKNITQIASTKKPRNGASLFCLKLPHIRTSRSQDNQRNYNLV